MPVTINGTGTIDLGANLKFSNSASSDANTLDDYEEGTWTGTLNMHSTSSNTASYESGGTNTGITTTGQYTKIGNQVYVHCMFDVTAYNAYAAKAISGLPFTAKTTAGPQNFVDEYCLAHGHIRGMRFVYNTTILSDVVFSQAVRPATTYINLQSSSTASAFSGFWYINNESGQGKYISCSGCYLSS